MLTRALTALSHIVRPIFPTPSRIIYLRVTLSKSNMAVANKQAAGWTLLEGRNSRLRPWLIASTAFVVPRFLCAAALSGRSLNIPENGVLMKGVVARHTALEVDTRLDVGTADEERLLRNNACLNSKRETLGSGCATGDLLLLGGCSESDALEVASSTRGGGVGSWLFSWRRSRRQIKDRARAEEKGVREASRLPTGIANQGNTCYLNSLLQSVYHAPGVKEAVLEAAVGIEGEEGGEGETLSALARVFRQLDEGGRPASTSTLTRAMGLNPRVQQDAQEFGRFLFMALEKECEGGSNGNDLWGTIDKLLGGRLVNYIECVDVPFSREKEEVFYDLSLDVKGSRTLERALDRYTEAELLADDNMWRTEEHGLQRARKGVRFVEFPPVLQFHLKRFEYDPFNDDLAKIDDRFEFPTELNVSPWLQGSDPSSVGSSSLKSSGSAAESELTESCSSVDADDGLEDSRRYRLSAVVMHVGTPTFGHYYAYVCQRYGGSGGERWAKLDDQRVTEVSEEDVLRDAFGGRGGLHGGRRKVQHGHRLDDLLAGQVGGGFADRSSASAYMLQYVREGAPSSTLSSAPPNRMDQAKDSPQP